MSKIKDVLFGVFVTLFGLVIHPLIASGFVYGAWAYHPYLLIGAAPFAIGLVACILTEWHGTDENGYLRGTLPDWAYLWSTPDEAAPGDVRGEPAVKWVYAKFGATVACIFWHLERNRGMGLSYLASRLAADLEYLDGKAWGFIENANGAWRWTGKIFPWFRGQSLYLGLGTQTTMVKGKLWIRPWFAIKVTHDGYP